MVEKFAPPKDEEVKRSLLASRVPVLTKGAQEAQVAIVAAAAGPLADSVNKLQKEGKLPKDSLFLDTFPPVRV